MPEQIGLEQMQNYSQALSRQLQRVTERYGLDTAETDALTAWVSTAMESNSQNISELMATLTIGSKEFELTLNRGGLHLAIIVAVMQAMSGVRYAAVIDRPGKPMRVIAYTRR